ncbi:MAG: hypothetical protein M1409_06965 [Actinobacteria bacterium]|nr:hypothetical protein [Actinomycetota bacterium]
MDISFKDLDNKIEIIKKNIYASSKDAGLTIVSFVIPDLRDDYYLNYIKKIKNACSEDECIFMLTDTLFGTGIESLIEKIKCLSIDVIITMDLNKEFLYKIKSAGIKMININNGKI